MKDILQQIQNLKEDFMNLIEVEGLGQPASDVPPSTNKIKKDRKTKNGKVELVSVEDELFPYDGNKREQYRQKIIDTINGMIQGTATLEDLLQIVREKKMPVKEGREANAYASESWRKVTELTEELVTYLKKSNKPMDKYEALLGKIISNRQKEEETSARRESDGTHDGIENSRNRQFEKRYINKSNREQNPKDRAYYYATRDKKTPEEKIEASIARHEKKAPLEEALKLLEGWAKDKRPKAAKKSIDGRRREYLNKLANVLDAADIYGSENVPDGDVKDLDRAEGRYVHAKKVSKIEEALSLMEAIVNETSDKKAQAALDAARQRYNRDSYLASYKLLTGDKSGETDGEAAQDKYIKHVQLQAKRAKRLGKKLVQDPNDHDSFKIEEALKNAIWKLGDKLGLDRSTKAKLALNAVDNERKEFGDAVERRKKNSNDGINAYWTVKGNRFITRNSSGQYKNTQKRMS